MTKQRDEIIKEILKNAPDMKVLWLDMKTNSRWSSEKKLVDLTEEEKKQFNLRRQFPNEIILDIEDKLFYEGIKKKLDDLEWSYKVWDTGSRGYHISILFDELSKHKLELRNRIRKYIIQIFGTDEKLAKESQWMALEHTPHIKTGNKKFLVDSVNSTKPNVIDEKIIKYCEEDLVKQQKIRIENEEVIKDYEKNDPYLKYIMEHTIESGDRNNILFKNLAIGLVKSGLSREEIIPFAQVVVEHCPGKNVGEFMGWVDKALTIPDMNYNKTELIQWSKEYGHPILYKMETDDDMIDFFSIRQIWNEIWSNTMESQEEWRDLCFHNLIGTVLNEQHPDIDLRIHLLFSCASSSGKDLGANLVKDILDRMGYKTNKMNDITDKTLVGGYNPNVDEFNVKNNLSEDEQERGNKKWRNPIEHGVLAYSNWLDFGEAENVFKPGTHNKRLQSILREVMDITRSVEKGVAGKEIKIKTNTTIVMTSYSLDKILHSMLNNGLFQRMLFLKKDLTDEEDEAIIEFESRKRFGKLEGTQFNKEKYILKLINKLRDMKTWYEENKFKFEYEDKADELVINLWKKTKKEYAAFFKEDKDVLDAMVRRNGGMLDKLCRITAISKKKTFISKTIIKNCFKLIITCIESVKQLLLNQDKGIKTLNYILRFIGKGNVSKGMVHERLDEQFKMKSPNKRTAFIKDLISSGYVTSYNVGKSPMLSLTESGMKKVDLD